MIDWPPRELASYTMTELTLGADVRTYQRLKADDQGRGIPAADDEFAGAISAQSGKAGETIKVVCLAVEDDEILRKVYRSMTH